MIQLRPKALETWRAQMTQAQLAKKAGVSRHTVMRLESGTADTAVTFDTINKLAKALGVDADVLVVFK